MVRWEWMVAGLILAGVGLAGCASSGGGGSGDSDEPIFIDLTSGQTADLVIGQANYTTGGANRNTAPIPGNATANSADFPEGNATFADDRLFLVDSANHRILGFDSIPDSLDINADFAVGQLDTDDDDVNQGDGSAAADSLSSPRSVASDGDKLVVADSGNNRVLIYNNIPSGNGPNANVVVGQSAMTGDGSAVSQTELSNPFAAIIADGKLIVADTNNHRVLIWDPVPASNGAPASIVLGQQDFDSNSSNQGGSAAADTFIFPRGLASDGDWLVVADEGNNRVLIWTDFPTTDGQAADRVIGQPDMTTTAGGLDDSTMDAPASVSLTELQLFVADRDNSRVLIYNDRPSANGQAADVVIGQPDFDLNEFGTFDDTFHYPAGVTAIGSQLLVSDTYNSRFLVFDSN